MMKEQEGLERLSCSFILFPAGENACFSQIMKELTDLYWKVLR